MLIITFLCKISHILWVLVLSCVEKRQVTCNIVCTAKHVQVQYEGAVFFMAHSVVILTFNTEYV